MSTNASLPTDPHLPNLAEVVDPRRAAEVFGELLHKQGLVVEGCIVDRVKYRPRRNCTLSYRLRLRDRHDGRAFEQRVAARLCGDDAIQRARRAAAEPVAPLVASRAGPALQSIPRLGLLTWWWPNDPKLVATHVLSDVERLHGEVLPQVVSALSGGRGRLVGHSIEIAQYVPEQRLTARVDLQWQCGAQAPESVRLYAKSTREPDGETCHAILRELQHSAACRDGRLRTPKAVLWQPGAGLHWQEGLAGVSLRDVPPQRTFISARQLGAQVAALHATPVSLARELTASMLHQRLADVLAVLTDALPDSQTELQHLAARLAAGLQTLPFDRPATLHGDLHPLNILVDGCGPALIDLDNVVRGPAELELGAWVAEGLYRALLDDADPLRDQSAWQALLDGYADAGGARFELPGLGWAIAWNLLTQRVWRCVVNLKPGRFERVGALIALASDLAFQRQAEVV